MPQERNGDARCLLTEVCVLCFVCVCDLINMVEFEVFEEKQQQSRDGLHDDFLVTVHVDPQLHALKDSDSARDKHKHNHTSP